LNSLRRLLLAAVLILSGCEELGLDALGVGEAPPPRRPPRLAFSETSFDFGRVAQGDPVEHHFAFTNDGDAALQIIDVRAACDTQVTLVGGNEIPGHGAGAVQGRFDTAATFGPQRRTVTVYSNDPQQRSILLTMTGEVLLDVVADPPQVYVGAVPPGAPLVREVALRIGSESVRLGVPQSDAAHLTLRIGPPIDGSAAAVLAIGTAADAPPGPFKTEVRVPTTSPRHPMLRVVVAGTIDPKAAAPRVRRTLPDDSVAPAAPPSGL
jgi:hypothetical protein